MAKLYAVKPQVKSIPLSAYFPDCVLPAAQCEKFFGVQDEHSHQHVLPVQQRIFDSSAKYLYMQGGVGGGKSDGFAAKCVQLCLSIPGNRGIVARHFLDDLYESAWLKVQNCIDRLVERGFIPAPAYTVKSKGEYTNITFHNGSAIKAVHGKNWRRGLGADHGFFWVDDALECLEDFFVGTNVTAGLLSRLRLPHVHFDPAVYDEQSREHGSLHGMVSSNPPPYGHWLHRLFGSAPGIHAVGPDVVEWLEGETMDNPFTGAGYATSLIGAQVKMGRSKSVVERVIYGKSVPAYKGMPVFPQFDHRRHVAPLRYNAALPLVCSWDFGFHHPGIVVSHIYKCKHGTNHYLTLSEIGECFSANIYELYAKYFVPHMQQLYPDAKHVLHAGDRAGFRKSSSNRDNRGDMRILIDEYHLNFKHRFLDLEHSLQYMRGLLAPREPCKCGMALVQVSQKCPILIGALEGGYHYPKNATSPVGSKPHEDRYFADIACAWRYGAENFIKWGIPWEDAADIRRQQALAVRQAAVHAANATPHGWMDMPETDRSFLDLITN